MAEARSAPERGGLAATNKPVVEPGGHGLEASAASVPVGTSPRAPRSTMVPMMAARPASAGRLAAVHDNEALAVAAASSGVSPDAMCL